jgi:hypothetical protein
MNAIGGKIEDHAPDFIRFRKPSSPRRKSEATDGTLRPIRVAIWGSVQPWQCFKTTTSRIRSGSSAGCDRASAKDFHGIRAVFTRGVA